MDLKGWRTLVFNGLAAGGLAVVAVLQAHGSEFIPAQYWPFLAMGLTVANAALRMVTDTPVGQSK